MSDMNKYRPSLFAASGFYLLAAIGLWIASFISGDLAAGAQILWPGITQETVNLMVNVFFYLPFMLAPIAIWAANRDGSSAALRLGPISLGVMLRVVVIALLSLMIVQNISVLWMIVCQKLGLNVFTEGYARPANVSELTLSVISAAVIAPLGEEFLFRGVMLSAWERRGERKAVIATAILFAMLHGSLLGLPGELFGGIMLGLLVLWTDSIYAGLAFHSVYNAFGAMLNYVSSAAPADATGEALMQSDLLAYMGGFAGVLGILLDILLMLALVILFSRKLFMTHSFRHLVLQVQAREAAKRVQAPPPDMFTFRPEHISAGSVVVLMASVISALGMYFFDFVTMLGG